MLELPTDIWRLILCTGYIDFGSLSDGKIWFLKLLIVNKEFHELLMYWYNEIILGPTVSFRATMICTNTCQCCGIDTMDDRIRFNQLNFMTDEPPRRVIIYCHSVYCFKLALHSQRDAIHRQSGLLYDVQHVLNHNDILKSDDNTAMIDRSNKTEQTKADIVTEYLYRRRTTNEKYMLAKWYEGMDFYYKLVRIENHLKHKDVIKISPF